jgi:release factor glutamine methyltransferase
VEILSSDLFAAVGERRFELVTANPPYIPDGEIAGLVPDIRLFEPGLALSGGADGLDVVRRIAREAPAHLEPGGVLAIEVGAGQAADVRELFVAAGFRAIEIARDYGRHERVVSGLR